MAAYQQQDIQVVPGNMQPPTEVTTIGESAALLTLNPTTAQPRWRCCVQSKATILILVWNVCIAIGLEFFSPQLLPVVGNVDTIVRICVYGVLAIFLLFYPLAGYLADAHWGRYKTIFGSLRFILLSVLIIIFLGILGTVISLAIALTIDYDYSYETLGSVKIISIVVLCLAFGLPILFGVFLIIFSLIAFSANVIQYGIDQLEYNARGENVVLYIYWYVWTCYMAQFIVKIMITLFGAAASYSINSFFLLIVLPIVIGITFCIKQCSIHWELVDTPPQTENSYKLIYQIIKFALSHNHNLIHLRPYNHSEALPSSRLDLAKEIYGGPFTTNQVEEVKSFLQIFCILFTLGPMLMAEIAVRELLPRLVFHFDRYPFDASIIAASYFPYDPLKSLISSEALTPLIIIVVLPLYVYILRPSLYNYMPGPLKRIGLGMVFIFLSALCTLLMDTSGHIRTQHAGNATMHVTTCFLNTDYDYDYSYYDNIHIVPVLHISSYVLTIQCILNAIGYMLFYISTFEFICAQSPQSLRGVLICSFFAIKGAFRLLGDLVLLAPFTGWNKSYSFPSCGFVYYLINALLVLAGIAIFSIAAKKCQRQTPPGYNEHYPNAEGYSSTVHDQNEDYVANNN